MKAYLMPKKPATMTHLAPCFIITEWVEDFNCALIQQQLRGTNLALASTLKVGNYEADTFPLSDYNANILNYMRYIFYNNWYFIFLHIDTSPTNSTTGVKTDTTTEMDSTIKHKPKERTTDTGYTHTIGPLRGGVNNFLILGRVNFRI